MTKKRRKPERAVREPSHARVLLYGSPGSGRTFSALSIAEGLRDGGWVLVIDGESGRSRRLGHRFEFAVDDVETRHASEFCEALDAIADFDGSDFGLQEGPPAVVVVEGISSAFEEAREAVARRVASSGGYTKERAWGEEGPHLKSLTSKMLGAPCHVVATCRTRLHYEPGDVRPTQGAPVLRDRLEYEFDVVVQLHADHTAFVAKCAYPECAIDGAPIDQAELGPVTPALGKAIGAWCSLGLTREVREREDRARRVVEAAAHAESMGSGARRRFYAAVLRLAQQEPSQVLIDALGAAAVSLRKPAFEYKFATGSKVEGVEQAFPSLHQELLCWRIVAACSVCGLKDWRRPDIEELVEQTDHGFVAEVYDFIRDVQPDDLQSACQDALSRLQSYDPATEFNPDELEKEPELTSDDLPRSSDRARSAPTSPPEASTGQAGHAA